MIIDRKRSEYYDNKHEVEKNQKKLRLKFDFCFFYAIFYRFFLSNYTIQKHALNRPF